MICHNCSIRNLAYKYDIRNKYEEIYRYKRYACDRELNRNIIKIEFNSNKIDDCHHFKHRIENISSCLVEKLVGYC